MDKPQGDVAGSSDVTSPTFSVSDLERVRGWSNPLEEIKRCVHDVVNDQVVAQPDAEAICAHDGILSYRELDSLSTRIACSLIQQHGIKPGMLVPLVFDKSKYNVVAMLSVLKCGAVIVPLDPSAPLTRLENLFGKVKGSIILCSRAHEERLAAITAAILPVDDESIIQISVNSEQTLPVFDSKSQCYLIFTSGTTGEPKGTLISHSAFLTSATVYGTKMFMNSESRVLNFAAHTFDASILEILTPLMLGGCVCIPDEYTRLNNIVSAIQTMRVNWALLTPSFVNFFSPRDVPSIKTLVLGGEAMNQSHVTTWAPRLRLINAYGPTETSVVAVCNNNITAATHPSYIGAPLAPVFVTDPSNHDRLLPVGEIGELLIHGPTLGCYLDNPEKNAESFIANPAWLSQVMPTSNKLHRLYKTGDLVKQNQDGTLQFIGRKDNQIKVHGQRVEIGEIEHHVNLTECVKHGLVVFPKVGHFKDRLVTMISLKESNLGNYHSGSIEVAESQTESDLARRHLAKSLPSYLVPSVWLTVQSIPLLPSGKLDRKKVVQWFENLSQDAYRQIVKLIDLESHVVTDERPATEMEAILRASWSRVLNLEENQVSLSRSFLSLGGDSISAMGVMGYCAKRNVSLTVQDLLRAKSIKELARRAKVDGHVTYEEETIDTPFDLSPIQTMFFKRPNYGAGHFNQSFLLRVTSVTSEKNLRSAIEMIVERHSMLRSRFSVPTSGESIQQQVTANVSGSYRMRCHRIVTQDETIPFIADSQKCLDPFVGPLFSADLFELDSGAQLVFLVCHHLVIDLVSWRIILEEIQELLLHPSQVSLGEKPLAFQTWAQLQAEQAATWDLDKVLPSQMPAGDAAFWGMEDQPDTYGNVICEGFEIDAETTSTMLTECHSTLNTEPIDILISALIYSFGQCFDDRPVPPIFTEGHGREPAGLDVNLSRTVGWFTTMYPVKVSASSDPIETVRQVKDYRRRVPDNGRPYFAARCLSTAGKEEFGHHWPSEVTFNYLGQYQQLERDDALLKSIDELAGESRGAGESGVADVGINTPRFGLFEISAVIVQGKLRFSFTFSRAIHHQERIGRWINECSRAVGVIAHSLMQMQAQATPTDFPLLSLTYEDLNKLNEEVLPRLGISSLNEVDGLFPASSMQTGLLLAQTKDSGFYQNQVICKLQPHTGNNADATKLALAWQNVVDRHSSLRCILIEAVGTSDGVYNQIVLKHHIADIVHMQCNDQNAALAMLQVSVGENFRHNAPPHRFTICQTSEGKVFFKINISHTIIDGKSIQLILRDLALAYEGTLPEGQGTPHSDYISYLQGLSNAPGLQFWSRYLEGAIPCEFPHLNDGLPAVAKQLHSVQYRIESDQFLDLQKFCGMKGLTFSTLLNTAWALTLRLMTGSDDVSFGYLSSDRTPEFVDAIGIYINMLVHRSKFSSEMKIDEILCKVQADYMEGLPFHNTSLADVQHALHLSGKSLFDTSLSYQRSQHTENEMNSEVSFPLASPIYDPTEFTINLNVEAKETLLDVDLAYWTDKISDSQASNIGSTFLHILRTIPQQAEIPLSSFNFLSEHHHNQLMDWNGSTHETINECVHEVIEQQARQRPEAPAVCAWDRDFTYGELDGASSLLAAHLVSLHAGPGTFVVSCFEKSSWAVVALMATLKAGAAAVTLDPKFPKSALEHRIRDVNAQVILTSPSLAKMFEATVPHVIQVSQSSVDQLSSAAQPQNISIQSKAKPTDPFFVIYTSGSTGKPKGVVLEHRAFMSSSNVFGSLQGINTESRVLQFSQYTFDVSLAEIFTTLTRGGCICVPSEHERYNDLAGAINRLSVNHLNLTPTVAGLLRPEEVPTVKALCLAGEATTKENIEVWGKLASSLYGPSECSVHSTYNDDLTRTNEPTNVGRPTFSNWIVDPNNHNILSPIGCIGEILIEGPILAREYLNDPIKTANSFIVDPSWAQGNRRFYKTGDLGRFNSDKTLTYVGRQDTQVKLNGQRLELGEVEYHVKRNLPSDITSSVEMIKTGGVKALAVFLCSATPSPATLKEEELLPLSESLREIVVSLEASLSKLLPPYMVPSVFIPIKSMPLTPSGKLNRRQLRIWCESLLETRVSEYRLAKKSSRAPSTTMELKLQVLWEKVLSLPPGSIRADDNFFSSGGDSLTCMKLVVAARKEGMGISVANIFQKPVLADFANDMSALDIDDNAHQLAEDVERFALVPPAKGLTAVLTEVASICAVPLERVEDIYPASPLQEGLMTLTAKIPGAYVAQNVYRLPQTINIGAFKEAWNRVFDEPILRTRLVHTKELGFLQVVLYDTITWNRLSSIADLTENTRHLPSRDGGALCQFSLIGENTSEPRFVFTAHHALYDGWSLPLLFGKLKAYYHNIDAVAPTSIPYSRFINYLLNVDVTESNKFWEQNLSEIAATSFPALPSPTYNVQATSRITKLAVSVPRATGSSITIPSTIRAAWALTMSVYSGSPEDVVFGENLTGRLDHMTDHMTGPTLVTVPMRVKIDPRNSVEQFLAEVQVKSSAVLPFQHAGLQSIKRLNRDTAIACDFQNLLVISTITNESSSLCTLESSGTAHDTFSSYPLTIICQIVGDTVEIEVHYDQKVISDWLVDRVVGEFEFLLQRLNSNVMMEEEIGQISLMNPQDRATIHGWNSKPLEWSHNCVHDVFGLQVGLQPADKAAILSHDGNFTYQELERVSTRLAQCIVELNPQCEIIPVCFEKSAFAIIAMLAIMKSGKAFVPLDHAAPIARLRDILNDTKSDLILCSQSQKELCKGLVDNIIITDQGTIESLGPSNIALPKVSSSSPAYCIFTSGSTGKPKGTIIDHEAFCTSAAAHGPALCLESTSRVLQFASYTFDVSLLEILTSLTIGATICVPSEHERMNSIEKFIESYSITWTAMTPTMSKTISPLAVPSLRTLALGGESMSPGDIERWSNHVNLISAYGPSEAAIATSSRNNMTVNSNPTNIGFATGSRLWVVDANNHNRLAPLGSVGELLIEGPLARGYLNDEDKTAAAFIENPLWSIPGPANSLDTKRKFYKTGDLVRMDSDGSLLFFKRKDTQKKVHGQRLELGEVEHFLNLQSSIKYALAMVPSNGPLSSRLVAMISLEGEATVPQLRSGSFNIVDPNECSAELFAIREHMCSNLPPYMVPTSWIVTSCIPFLSSGKLDRRQSLQWVESMSTEVYRLISAVEAQEDEMNGSEIELSLRKIMGETLNLPPEKIGLHKSFLHLGGDSITAMQVHSRCQAKDIGISVKDILQSKSIKDLATRVDTLPQTRSFAQEEDNVEFELSPMQKLYFKSVGNEKTHFNQSTIFSLSKRIEVDVVRRAIDTIVKTHPMLRARFILQNDTWRQKIISHASDTYRFNCKETVAESVAKLVQQSQEELDIQNGPTFSVNLFDLGDKQVLSLLAHHLCIDVVSWRVIIQDLEDMLISNQFEVMSALSFQTWCRLQAEHTSQLLRKSTFTPANVPAADFAYWGMENKSNTYADVITKSFELDERISTQLLEGCHGSMNTEPVDVFLAVVLYSLRSVLTDRSETPTVYNEGHGREPWTGSGINISRTVGWFTTITPLFMPTTVNGEVSLVEVIRWVKELRGRFADKGREHFARQVSATTEQEHPLMEVAFNYLGKLQQLERKDTILQPFHQVNSTESDIGLQTARFSLLDVSVGVSFGKLQMSVGYNKQMKHQNLLRNLVAKCRSSLEDAAISLMNLEPQRTLSEFPLLPLSYGGIERLSKILPRLKLESLESIEDAYPLSPMQQGILISQQKNPDLYNCEFVFEVLSVRGAGVVDPAVFAESWQDVVGRHQSLRVVFVDGVCQDGEIGQVVLRSHRANVVHIVSTNDEVTILAKQAPHEYAELEPPHKLTICSTSTSRVVCKLEISHAISDGSSFPILFRDLSEIYQSKVSNGLQTSLQPAPLYSDYIAHISSASDNGLRYWKSYLEGIQPCHLSALNDGFNGQNRHECEYLYTEISPLQTFCAEQGLTLSNVLQLAWGMLLRVYTGSDEVVFGYLTSGRDAPIPGLENAVGAFINTLICRINFSATNTVSQALEKIQKDFGDAMEFQSCSLAEIQHELSLSGISLFNTAFTFQKQANSDGKQDDQALKFDIIEANDPSEYLAVNATATDSTLGVGFHYWTDTLSKDMAQNMAKTFEHILNQIVSSTNTSLIKDLDILSSQDRQQILTWNSISPERIERPIHEMILQQQNLRPAAQAVCAYDCSLTYAELSALATSLAVDLVEAGVGPEIYVPISFEKGVWSVVGIMAILMAGGAFVPLDASHPKTRLQHIINGVSAKLVLCSPQYQNNFAGIVERVLPVDATTVTNYHGTVVSKLPIVSPNHAALVFFTSGTSGVPKGTIIEHGAFCTSAVNHAKAQRMNQNTRVFHFASLTFDAGIQEILTTLIVGGLICIPSDDERMNDIAGAMERMSVNWMFSTPSLATTFIPDSMPSLKTLVLGGEAVGPADLLKWKGKLAVINGYGPSETTICATARLLLGDDGEEIKTSPMNIGKAVTGRTWVVDPDNHHILTPIGAIGELVIETRGCGRGYLNNPVATKQAFIDCPPWLEAPREQCYKSGDLVRYNSDGSLIFISRKDSQVKINGQRVEISEIEYHVKQLEPFAYMDLVVDLVSPEGGTNAIALFFCPTNTILPQMASTDILLEMSDDILSLCRTLDSSIASKLPAYMIPSVFFPLSHLPLTRSSRKLDRSKLRNIVSSMPSELLVAYRLASGHNSRAPSTAMEKKLQSLWASVLPGVSVTSIGADSSFLRLGGDSIAAMKLAVAARGEGVGVRVTVADIFRMPTLAKLAAHCASVSGRLQEYTRDVPEPFTLLGNTPKNELLEEVANECRVNKSLVVDVYPCSPLQEALITLAMKDSGAYIAHHTFELSVDIDIQKFKIACQKVIEAVDILRTRVVHMKSSKFMQVVLRTNDMVWQTASSISDARDHNMNIPAFNGAPLSGYTIVKPENANVQYFVMSLHHSLYDGWSLPMVFGLIESAYLDSLATLPTTPYSSFIRYLSEIDQEASDNFWKSTLAGASPLQFPHQLVDSDRVPQIEAFSHSTKIPVKSINHDTTMSSIIRAAWSLLVSAHSGSEDVVFGEVLAGRDIPMDGIEEVIAPTIVIVPTRIKIEKQDNLATFLQKVQKRATDVIPYQHAGLQRIKTLDTDTAIACNFNNLLVIQPTDKISEPGLWRPYSDGFLQSNFSTYPLMLECHVGSSEINITAIYDKDILSSWAVERMILQLDGILQQLISPSAGLESTVGDIQTFSSHDMELVKSWNIDQLEVTDRCLHHAFEQHAISQPHAIAVSSWDGDMTYSELRDHASQLAQYLVSLGVRQESFVPICMDRSKWVIVSILGILMAGATYVPLDPKSPLSRQEGIIKEIEAQLILCSADYGDQFDGIETAIIDEQTIKSIDKLPDKSPSLASSDSPCYVIFTSGSTGKPKGVVLDHKAASTSIWSWREKIMIGPETRIFHFASLAFDASIMEIFGALTFGATLCIPSEEQRLNFMVDSINHFKATWLFMTPSLANVIDPERVPTLKTLVCGGEAMTTETVLKWGHKVTLMNVYGPTESCILATVNVDLRDPVNIGNTFPAGRSWITDPHDHNRLAPLSSIGELCIEGSILSRGYLNNAQKTSEAFVTAIWPGLGLGRVIIYKTGDLVKYAPDGSIIFIGRKDHQVKIRGQRIELGEIEHTLDKDAHIRHGLVVVPKTGILRKRLVAVVSLNELIDSSILTQTCQLVQGGERARIARETTKLAEEDLSTVLPPYMVPSTWLVLEAIPLSISSKLERALVQRWVEEIEPETYAIALGAGAGNSEAKPVTGTNKFLQEAVAHVLNLPISRVVMEDSFMGAGGDSITAMGVMALCRKKYNLQCTLPDILRSKSLFELAGKLVSAGKAVYQEEKLDQAFDLSPIQQAYIASQPNMNRKYGAHFNQSFLLEITRSIPAAELKRAVEMLVVHHSMLRSRFTESRGIWHQRVVENPSSSYRFLESNLNDEAEIPARINDSQSCLDIIDGPLFAADDLEEILTTGSSSMSKPLSFQSWCIMQSMHAQEHLAIGKLPFRIPPPNVAYWLDDHIGHNTYGDTECETFSLSEAVTRSILGDCNKPLRTEPVDLLLSAISQSFSAVFFDRSNPVIHNESHGREPWDSTIDLSRTVGWFTTITPIFCSVDENSNIVETVKRMKDARRKVDGNGRPYFSYRYLTSEGREEFKEHEGPMEIVFNYLGRIQQLEQKDALFRSYRGPTGESNSKLMSDVGEKTTRMALFEISAIVIQDKIQFSFLFNRHMKKQSAIREWIAECRTTLEHMVDSVAVMGSEPQFTLSDFPLLPISYEGLQTIFDEILPAAGITPQSVEDIYPCAPMQEGMLLSQLRDPAVYKFHAIFEVSNSSAVDPKRLARAWNQVVSRHSALRTIFVDSVYKEDVFNQVVIKQAGEQGVLIACGEKDAIEVLESPTAVERRGQVSLPHKFTICQTSMGKVYFKLEMNHAIMDGGSLPVLFHDLAAAYNGNLPDRPAPLYSVYVKYLRSQNLDVGAKFWKRYLENARACYFPSLNNNNNSTTKRQLKFVNLKFGRFPELVRLCSEKKVTLANVMQAAWAVCLRSWTKSDDVCWGYLLSGRDNLAVEGIQELFGPVLNMSVTRMKFSNASTFEEVIEGVQSDYLESLGHQHFSLAKIQHDLGLGRDSLFNTAVSIQGQGVGAPAPNESSSISFTAVNAVDPNEYAITLNIGIAQNEEGAALRYWSDILSSDQANILVGALAKVLDSIVSNPKQSVADIILLEEPQQPVLTEQTSPVQEAQIRMIIKECVTEILGQMFNSNNAHNIPDITSLVNRQIAETAAASSLPRSMADFSFGNQTERAPKKRSISIAASTPASPIAQKLLTLWSEYLQIPETSIKSTDSFFTLGADSIVAMQLVGSARDVGLSLSVANIFRCPVFEEMVKVTRMINSSTDKAPRHNERRGSSHRRKSSMLYQNFSLLEQTDVDSFLQENVCPKIKLFRGGIIDVLPATDFQALSVTGSLLESRWLLNYFFLEGSGTVDLKRLRQSINQVVDAFDILRTVFVPYNSQFFQVVLRNLNPVFNVEVTDNLEAFTSELQQRDRVSGPKLGESYLRFTVAKLRNSDNHRIIIRLSHAQYDGVCLPRIVDALRSAYHGEMIPQTPSFSSYVRSAVGKTTSEHYEYWKGLLEGSKMTELVHRRGPNYSRGPEPPTMLRRIVKTASLSHEGIMAATIVKAAWSLTLAELSASSDVIFGNVISGRNGSISGIENIVGPCVNTNPVRAKFQAGWTALDLLKHLQDQQTSNMAYESLGFREIIKHCTSWENWTNFSTTCQHQNIQLTPSLSLGNNKYSFGGVGSQDDFADFSILSIPHGAEEMEIMLTFALPNIHMTKTATENIFNTLCEKTTLFSQNPSTILPDPSELNKLPRSLPEDPSALSARRMSRSLDNLNRKHLLLYSDMLTRGWRQVLGEEKSIDSESSFFELGGDIMGLAQLGGFLEGEGFKIKLEDLVNHPVLMEQLWLLARDSDGEVERIVESEVASSASGEKQKKVKGGMWKSIKKIANVKGRKQGVVS
ncbi:hypothetical protein HYFRA_00000332 [Hymenoscyphus fraxineus]|uniref:Carrier domain-containing protein n=1 Tax=Hymenoscyphus fraxineus TaxID=746836 RepID=A0A9N9L1Y7_9HELO|nr:hypothetical protein HYFRA_00000332 [Hymenoscyphus fraxineus]